MLHAGPDTGDHQRRHQRGNALAEAGHAEADAGKRRTERQHEGHAEALREPPRRNLQSGKGEREHRLHQAEHGVAQPEFALPYRQHHIDEIGIAVVQRVRAAGHAHRTPLLADGRRGGCGLARRVHGFIRRSIKVVLTKLTTRSPFWFMPVERIVMRPSPGRLSETRISTTSLA